MRARTWGLLSLMLGCNALLAEESPPKGDDGGLPGESSSSGEPADAAAEPDAGERPLDAGDDVTTSSSSGGSSGSMLPAPSCGVTLAYADSPWPMAAACPTRPGAVAAPRLQNPRILWRKSFGVNDAFVSPPTLGADDTVYASLAIRDQGAGYLYYVVGVREGNEVARIALPEGPAGPPTIAANGMLYVRTPSWLVAMNPALAAPVWTRAVPRSPVDSPVLLDDGSIVTLAGHEMLFTRPGDGASTVRVVLGSTASDPSFVGSIAVSETGGLYAVSRGGGAAPGHLRAYEVDGAELFPPVPLSASPLPSPSFTESGKVFVRGVGILSVHARATGVLLAQSASGHSEDGPWPARSGARYFLSGGVSGPFSYDTDTSTRTDYANVGNHSDFSVTGDGSVMFARSTLTGSPVSRISSLESWNADGSPAWSVALEPEVASSYTNPAIGRDGTAYLANARTFYAIGE